MHIYVSSLLKYKMHLHLCDSVEVHLHYATVKFEVQIYIYIALLKIVLLLRCHSSNHSGGHTWSPNGWGSTTSS
jgi:hypothetical protein